MSEMKDKKKSKHPGIRFREHPTRKHGKGRDKYFFIRYQREGKRVEEGVGWASDGWTMEDVSILLADLKKAHKVGEGPARLREKRQAEKQRREQEEQERQQQERDSITFGQYYENTYKPIAKTNKKQSSYKTEESYYASWIKPILSELSLKSGIAPFHIEKIKKTMLDAEKSPRTVQYALAIIRQIWNMARRDGLVKGDSPAKSVKIPQIDNRRLRFLSHEEVDILMPKLKEKSDNVYNFSLISIHTGMRAGEIFNLTWGDIDIDRGIISIRDGKNKRTRTVYMTEDVKKIFQSLERKNSDELVFRDRNNGKITDISNSFQRTVEDLNLNQGIDVGDRRRRVVFHTLRHTFASWLVENGTDLYTVKELMGHSTLAMTERYSHLGANTLQSAVKNLEQKLSGAKKTQENKTENVVNFAKREEK